MPLFSEPTGNLSQVLSSVLTEENSRPGFTGLKKKGGK